MILIGVSFAFFSVRIIGNSTNMVASAAELKYNIFLSDFTNTFVTTGYFQYKIESTNSGYSCGWTYLQTGRVETISAVHPVKSLTSSVIWAGGDGSPEHPFEVILAD